MLKSRRIWSSLARRAQHHSLWTSTAALKSTVWEVHATAQRSTYAASNRHDTAARTQRQTVETITSTSNALVKHCVKLRTNARYRAEHRQFLLTGLDLLQEAAGGGDGNIHAQVLFVPKQADVTNDSTSLPGVPCLTADRLVVADENVLKKLTGLSSVDSVTAVAQLELPPPVNLHGWQTQGTRHAYIQPTTNTQQAVQQEVESMPVEQSQPPRNNMQHDMGTMQTQARQPQAKGQQQASVGQSTTKHQLVRLLALDCVQDPGNMGTLIRSALAFGWDAIYLLPGCCDPYNEKAVRASRGAVLRMPIAAGNLEELVQLCAKGDMVLIAAEPDPEDPAGHTPCHTSHQDLGVCLVLGSEGRGLSPAVLQLLAQLNWRDGHSDAVTMRLNNDTPRSATIEKQQQMEDSTGRVSVALHHSLLQGSLRIAIEKACKPVAIPMAGAMESLNVGVAGSILMFMLSPTGSTTLSARLATLGLSSLWDIKASQASN